MTSCAHLVRFPRPRKAKSNLQKREGASEAKAPLACAQRRLHKTNGAHRHQLCEEPPAVVVELPLEVKTWFHLQLDLWHQQIPRDRDKNRHQQVKEEPMEGPIVHSLR